MMCRMFGRPAAERELKRVRNVKTESKAVGKKRSMGEGTISPPASCAAYRPARRAAWSGRAVVESIARFRSAVMECWRLDGGLGLVFSGLGPSFLAHWD